MVYNEKYGGEKNGFLPPSLSASKYIANTFLIGREPKVCLETLGIRCSSTP